MLARWMRFVRGWPRALRRQWPLLVVLVLVAIGVWLIVVSHWRRGAMMIGGATGLAGLMRLVLPERVIGLLAVRGRFWDTAVTGLAGLAIIVLALVVPPS